MGSDHGGAPIGSTSTPTASRASRVPVKKRSVTNSVNTQTPSETNPALSETKEPALLLKPEKSRSVSPKKKPTLDAVGRKTSVNLPMNIPKGKVSIKLIPRLRPFNLNNLID